MVASGIMWRALKMRCPKKLQESHIYFIYTDTDWSFVLLVKYLQVLGLSPFEI